MLSPSEFTVGTFGSAAPLSLIFARTPDEGIVFVGQIDGQPAAVFLTGRFAFQYFLSAGRESSRGLIIPGVRFEVDETSLFDPDESDPRPGTVIRSDTRLVMYAYADHTHGRITAITLHDELSSAGELRAGFTSWQVVIGAGQTKRVLWSEAQNFFCVSPLCQGSCRLNNFT